MHTENERIFVRETKTGFIATYNGVKGKAKTMFKAIERAKKNYDWLEKENNDALDSVIYSMEANINEIDHTRTGDLDVRN